MLFQQNQTFLRCKTAIPFFTSSLPTLRHACYDVPSLAHYKIPPYKYWNKQITETQMRAIKFQTKIKDLICERII